MICAGRRSTECEWYFEILDCSDPWDCHIFDHVLLVVRVLHRVQTYLAFVRINGDFPLVNFSMIFAVAVFNIE